MLTIACYACYAHSGSTHHAKVWLHRDSGLRSVDGQDEAALVMVDDYEGLGPVSLTGSTGHHNAPQLLRITGDDPDNSDDAYSDGDFVRLRPRAQRLLLWRPSPPHPAHAPPTPTHPRARVAPLAAR